MCHPGSRLPRPLIVEVTDETGASVDGALISFRVPENGVSGTFRNGLKSEILTTDGDGRAALRSFEAGGFAGRFQIRMTIAKGEARAGAISNQYIAPDTSRRAATFAKLSSIRPRGRLAEVGGLVLAIAAAGFLKTAISNSSSHTVQLPPVIGPPSVTVGKP